MAITPKQIIETAVDLGRGVVSRSAGVLRREKAVVRPRPSGSPSTVGAPKPGQPRGHKSATAARNEKS